MPRIRVFALVLLLMMLAVSPAFCVVEGSVLLIPAQELGLDPVVVQSRSNCIHVSLEENGNIRIVPLSCGEAEITVCNAYSETARINVTVTDTLAMTYSCIPHKAPAVCANVLDYGAIPDDGREDTAAIQKAIDSLKEGGTVYIPAGVYDISYLEFRHGTHLRLAGCLPDALSGYTEGTAEWIRTNAAVLHTLGKSSHLFYNLKRGGYCTEGISDFSLSGGVIDCENRTMAFVWSCADDVLLENCIIKDSPNNHAIQIDGCSNVLIRNVMFAGYLYGGVKTRETIQIEPTTHESISSNYETSPVKCKNGDFHFNSNIVITGCYFGKSDVSGPQLTALGHHVVTGGKTVCNGLEFSSNVIDNPLLYGLHLLDYANVNIYDNTFISDETIKPLARDTSLICLAAISKDGSYAADNGITVTYACANEVDANKHVNIHDNRFILGAGTPMRALFIEGTFFTPGASIVRDLYRADAYGETPYPYSGYLVNHNYMEDIVFHDNEIIVKDSTRYTDYPIYAGHVYDFTCTNNTIDSAVPYSTESILNDESVPGLLAIDIKNGTSREIVINGRKNADYSIYLVNELSETVVYPCYQDAVLRVRADIGGQIELTTQKDGSIVLIPAAEEGYVFIGWQTDQGIPLDITASFSINTLLFACFTEI